MQEQYHSGQPAKHVEGCSHQGVFTNYTVKPPVTRAEVPEGAPARKSWHVERQQVMRAVLEALTVDGEPQLVGLVGDSGSGKTTAASEVIRSTEVREAFSDGIVWLTVNEGANERLPSLMLQLGRMVDDIIGGGVGRGPTSVEDGAAYIRQRMVGRRGRKRARCLVVADNVCEKEVVSKLLETSMWVLLSTRNENLVTVEGGEAVRVDELSDGDAKSVLRSAAELPPEVRLPGDAVDLIDLCGRVAMDIAFVGRWSTVRGRQDRRAWSDAADNVREEMKFIGCYPARRVETAAKTRTKRRKAILAVGFEDLATGVDDERVPRLYLSLAVLPDGHAFTVKDAAVLLYDRPPSAEDEVAVASVVQVLERWSVLHSEQGTFRMHDAHSSFARENLMDRGDVRRPAVRRWVRSISRLETLLSIELHVLKGLWRAVERVCGSGWEQTRPYAAALVGMEDSNPLLQASLEALGWFQDAHGDIEGASDTCRRLLNVQRRELGPTHPHTVATLSALALCAEQLGKFEEAAEWRYIGREALPGGFQADEVQHVHEPSALSFIALTLMTSEPRDTAQAETLLRRSLAIREAKLGQESILVAYTLHDLGVCVRQAGRLKAAEELLRRCLAIKETKLGPGHVHVACTLHELGLCLREEGRSGEARTLMKQCLAIQEAGLGRGRVRVTATSHELDACAP